MRFVILEAVPEDDVTWHLRKKIWLNWKIFKSSFIKTIIKDNAH